jgi:Spy/CpxP family protein refolding chaperone
MEVPPMTRAFQMRAAVLALAATMLVSATAFAHGTGRGPDGRRAEGLKQALNLTDEQVQAMREVRARTHATAKQHYQQFGQVRRELRQLIVSGADEAAIQAKQAEVEALLKQGVQMRVDALREIVPILTPEQRQKFAEVVDQHHRSHGRRGPRTQG